MRKYILKGDSTSIAPQRQSAANKQDFRFHTGIKSKLSPTIPPSRYKIVNKICRPVKARYARAKDNFLLDPSNTWRENSNGLLACPKQPKYILFLGVCCPCIIHGINASDIMTGEEGKFEKDPDTGKWVGARFVIIQAVICCGGPCCCITSPAAGGAVREQIFAQSLENH